MSDTARRDLIPSSAIPLAYFLFAHAALAVALAVLAVHPALAGPFFYHPRMVALVHLLTLGWISGSILGAFYIVAPLALRMPLPARRADWIACGAFAVGATGMVGHIWLGDYDGMAPDAVLVTSAIGWVAVRAFRGLARAPVPAAVKLHVRLAFINILAAAAFGVVIGLDRSRGFLGVSPLSATFAHAHLAAVGWATMMVVGLSYRLIPMMLPAAMPTGAALALSAVLIESGVVLLVVLLLAGSAWLPLGAVLIVGGLVSFVTQVRRTLAHRLPRPPALPRRDWSTWQAHTALLWLLVSAVLGVLATTGIAGESQPRLLWIYGVAGLVGFLAQIIVGMQGRLVPLYVWYRALASRGGAPPERGANDLPSAAFARPLFICWTIGVPLLGWGLATGQEGAIRSAAAVLCGAVGLGVAYLRFMIRRSRTPATRRAGTDADDLSGARRASHSAGLLL
jgi:hypothetical protein